MKSIQTNKMKQITCRICNKIRPGVPGSEVLACGICASRAIDKFGNKVMFDTELFSHGIEATHFTSTGSKTDNEISCFIDSIPCKAVELRFGDVGIKIAN